MDFDTYVAERGRALERYAFALTGDVHRAQDLVQAALLSAFRRWPAVIRQDHPDVYVRRIVTTTLIDWTRRRSWTERPHPDLAGGVARQGLRRPGQSPPDDPAEIVVARDALDRALAALSPVQRAVVVLRHLDGYDDDTVARVLGCSVATVRAHASRGLRRLRDHLDPRPLP